LASPSKNRLSRWLSEGGGCASTSKDVVP
jgi:hypothetical protein